VIELTPVQSKIVDFVRRYRASHACGPLTKDVQEILGHRSTGGVHREIQKVVDKGVLVWDRRQIRTLRLSELGEGAMPWGCLKCARLLPNASTTTEKFETLTVTPTSSPAPPTCAKCQSPLARLVWANSKNIQPQGEGAPTT